MSCSCGSHDFDQRAINALRVFSIDAIEKAKSGHPGTPLGAAPILWELYAHHLKHNPAHPEWMNRDRFVLSVGHASALLYSTLYLMGYGLKASDLENFRQLGSPTPGHPEFGTTAGVEVSTGPLGQGLATAVGLAVAEAHLASLFNKPNYPVVDHYTYVLTGDGCLQEGVSYEAASFAGSQRLGKLIVLYDRNGITIDGSIDVTFTENVVDRFKAANWEVLDVSDANDTAQIGKAIEKAKTNTTQPSLIICHSHIGYSSPLQDSPQCHGAPLGADNVSRTKQALGWDPQTTSFDIPNDLTGGLDELRRSYVAQESEWQELWNNWEKEYPVLASDWKKRQETDFSLLDDPAFKEKLFAKPDADEATRSSSSRILNTLASAFPQLMGGSADLAGSNKTWMKEGGVFSPEDRSGRNLYYGIREFAMACIMNGLNLHGGILGYCSTFFVFSDYMKSAIRSSALMNLPSLYLFTHDSVGVGEDGPTHQPIEHLTMLRAMPRLVVYRPADATECAASWVEALKSRRPSVLVLSRQNLPQLENSSQDVSKGAYVLSETDNPQVILMGSGSELTLLVSVQEQLKAQGIGSRVVSVPSMDLFLEQDQAYQERILPANLTKRFACEAGSTMPWYRLVGLRGRVHGIDHFGSSAPAKRLFEAYGFTSEQLLKEVQDYLKEV